MRDDETNQSASRSIAAPSRGGVLVYSEWNRGGEAWFAHDNDPVVGDSVRITTFNALRDHGLIKMHRKRDRWRSEWVAAGEPAGE